MHVHLKIVHAGVQKLILCARTGSEFLGLEGKEELVLLDLEAIRQHLA